MRNGPPHTLPVFLGLEDRAPSEGWQDVLQDLRRIRYGRPTDWPDTQSVFRQAPAPIKKDLILALLGPVHHPSRKSI